AEERTLAAEQQQIPIARAPLLPQLIARASRVRQRDELSAPGQPFIVQGSETFYSDEYSIQLTQPLFDWQKYTGYKQAQAQTEVAEFEFNVARQELLLRVSRRYFAVLAAQDNLGVAVAERKAVARQLELADERLQVGLGTTTDLFDAQARFSLAEATEISAQNFLHDANQALIEVVGEFSEALTPLKAQTPLEPPDPNDVEAWIRMALENNLEYLISRQVVEVAENELKRQRAGHYPWVDFIVQHNNVDADGSISGPGNERTSTDALIQLNVPILEGGAVVSRAREAGFRLQAAQKRNEAARRAVERSTRATFSDVTSSIRQVQAFDRAVTASESALEAKNEGFAAGLDTNLDVLDAQRDLFRVKRDYLRARYDYILNWLRLKQVQGMLNEEDLRQVNGWLG
ncbi:MAG: TolC family outer membrane protein, partial [Gammaproteobacteria bacterium]|nr:TolC family outer membrane protein [Gammaproteobacteria bacterium]